MVPLGFLFAWLVAAQLLVVGGRVLVAGGEAQLRPLTHHASPTIAPLQSPAPQGTWRGRILNGAGDSVMTTWTWVTGSDGTGNLTFARETESLPARVIASSQDSLVFELLQPLDGPNGLILAFSGAVRGDSIVGTVLTRISDGRTGRRPFDAVRVAGIPAFEPGECMFERGDWAADSTIECGWLVAPEARYHVDGPAVRLAVVIVRSPNAGRSPVVFLHGGPGAAGIDDALPRAIRGPFAQDRELIFYDQRASGYSQPVLCPDFNDSIAANRNRIMPGTGTAIRSPLIRACVQSLRAQGIDPDAYTTPSNAHDLADLRRALGYAQWDVNGASYGSRLALEAMRTDPLGIRSAVLIGPLPPGQRNQLAERLTLQRMLQRLFAECARTTSCHEAFPDPEADLATLSTELEAEPLRSLARNGDTILVNATRLRAGINSMMANTSQLGLIPLVLSELRRGDRLRAAETLAPTLDPQAGQVSRVLNNLVNCHESHGAHNPATADSLNALLLPLFQGMLDDAECALWRTTFALASVTAPVHSDIPTLILTGEYDPRTPPDNAHRAAATLSRVYVYEFPAFSHSGRPLCLRDIMRQFLDDPLREPDASCIARMPGVTFHTRWPG